MLTQRAKQQVRQIKQAPRRMIKLMVDGWVQAFDAMWADDGGVEARLAELGVEGAELLTRSGALVTFLVTQLTGEDQATINLIMAKIASIPATSVAPDGTVTLA